MKEEMYQLSDFLPQIRYHSEDDLQTLEEEFSSIDFKIFDQQLKLLESGGVHVENETLQPFLEWEFANESYRKIGEEVILRGEFACLVVAGGQGSRLGFSQPKGFFPISPIGNKTLFQLVAEKVAAASLQFKATIPLLLMVAPESLAEIKSYFSQNNHFGLTAEQLIIFPQGKLPFLSVEAKLLQSSPSHLCMGPDGNGGALYELYRKKLWHDLYAHKVRYLHFIPIDNPLADPCDPILLGYHCVKGDDISLKAALRKDVEEKVGVIVRQGPSIKVVEYTEMPQKEAEALDEEGSLKHKVANLSLFCFKMDFIQQHANDILSIPLHMALKKTQCWNPRLGYYQEKAWKFERYIFDVLPFTRKVSALLYPREEIFSPLKNSEGIDSPQTVAASLIARDRAILSKIFSFPIPEEIKEIDLRFHYPTAEDRQRWKDKEINSLSKDPYLHWF